MVKWLNGNWLKKKFVLVNVILVCFLFGANLTLGIEDEFSAESAGPDERLETLQIYFETEMYEEAAALLDELMAEFPNEPRFQYLRAIVAYQKGNYSQAEKVFTRFIEDYPDVAEPYYLLAEISLNKDNPESARIYLSKYCDLVPEDIQAQEKLTLITGREVTVSGEEFAQTALFTDGKEASELVQDIGFYGACLPSYQEKALKLVNGSHRMWSSMGIDFAYPLDLRGKQIMLNLKGRQGGERIELTFRDKFARDFSPQLVLAPDETIGPEWQKVEVALDGREVQIDLSCVVHMGLEFGFSTAHNPAHSTLYLKDIVISDAHN